jgi:pyruvate/2-oxoglutarate dehydrogenase complex dihydrolipoamide dehydrogenase (E3) component
MVESFREGSQRSIESTSGVDLLAGEAHFTGPHAIEVRLTTGEVRQLSAPIIVINAGARPSAPPPTLERIVTLDSTSIMELDTVPDHLLVIGGGYVALEFSQMFRRFGSRVTLLQRSGQLLGREDPDVAAAVAAILREDGIEVLLDTSVISAEASPTGGAGGIELAVRSPAGERTLTGSHVLVAVGRTPNTEALNLTAAGVATDARGFIPVNERLETGVTGIYALGDINGGPAFTHISYDDYRIMRANLLEGGHATTTGRLVPYTVFIDPQLGRVGLSEQAAREHGRNIKVAKMPMSDVARALEVDESRGFMKAVVDADTQQILGCAVLGIEGGELMSMLEVAMIGHVPYTALRDAVFAHPTLAESLNNLFATLDE